jgi:hypothetical protein
MPRGRHLQHRRRGATSRARSCTRRAPSHAAGAAARYGRSRGALACAAAAVRAREGRRSPDHGARGVRPAPARTAHGPLIPVGRRHRYAWQLGRGGRGAAKMQAYPAKSAKLTSRTSARRTRSPGGDVAQSSFQAGRRPRPEGGLGGMPAVPPAAPGLGAAMRCAAARRTMGMPRISCSLLKGGPSKGHGGTGWRSGRVRGQCVRSG